MCVTASKRLTNIGMYDQGSVPERILLINRQGYSDKLYVQSPSPSR